MNAVNTSASRTRLLLVDDDPVFCEVLAAALDRRSFEVSTALDCEFARQLAAVNSFEHAVVDLRIGAESGLDLVRSLMVTEPAPRIVVLTGYGSIATAVQAIKLGAVQYLTKPAAVDDIVAALGPDAPGVVVEPHSLRPLSVRRLEWEHIQRVLAEHDGNVSATARTLGIHRRTLQRKLLKRPVRH
jgi:two-component system response regulator RegA